MPRKQRADEAANIPLTTKHASSKDELDDAGYHAVLSALFKELFHTETNPNSTATQLVTVAVRHAVSVLGGCGVDVDAYLAKTCVLEAETGRPPAIALEDVMALWTAWEEEEEERERAASDADADAEGSAAVDATPDAVDSSFRQFLRRFDRGRDVYGHWREEAHPNETLRADTFANLWAWMFRACKEEGDDDRPDTMETIEAFAMNRARKKRRNGADGSMGECAAPSSGASDKPSPGGAEPIRVPEFAPAAQHPEDEDRLSSPASRLGREDRLRAVHERRLASERTVRILATKRADQLRNECNSLTHRIAQLEEENADLHESLKRANVMLADQVRDPVRERSSDDCASIEHFVAPLEEENVTLYDIFENAESMMVDPDREPVQERDARGSSASNADAEKGGSAFGGALSTCPGPVFQHQNPWFPTRPSGPQPMDFTQGGLAGGSALVYWPPAAYYAPARPPMPVGAYNVSAAPASFETRTYYAPLAGAYNPYAVRNPQDSLRAELLAWQTAHHDLRCAYSGAVYELDGVRAQLSQARDALARAGTENRLLQSRLYDVEDKRRALEDVVLRLTEEKRAIPKEF
jgi:predicted  nucleic acid-binding Zn-ribbon protein